MHIIGPGLTLRLSTVLLLAMPLISSHLALAVILHVKMVHPMNDMLRDITPLVPVLVDELLCGLLSASICFNKRL